ncbi:MAG: hypothetical protein H7839_22930 [Magnetococcus sp. YQC-5]
MAGMNVPDMGTKREGMVSDGEFFPTVTWGGTGVHVVRFGSLVVGSGDRVFDFQIVKESGNGR